MVAEVSMTESNTDYRAPPTLTKETIYQNWKDEIGIWCAFTGLKEEQRGPAVFFRLQGEARDAIRELGVDKLKEKDGVKTILATLDKMFLKDACVQAYEAYEAFESFKRPLNMTITDYVLRFETLYRQAKSHKMDIDDGVLAYRLLNSSGLSHEEKQLVKATLTTRPMMA